MFEFHGWATIRGRADCADLQRDPSPATIEAIRGLARGVEGTNRAVDLRPANGDMHLWIAGRHNHRRQEIITFFAAVAERAPGSYGALYALDAADGTVLWTAELGAAIEAPPALAYSTLYVPTADGGHLIAYTPSPS